MKRIAGPRTLLANVAAVALALLCTICMAADGPARAYAAPRTADGHPDLQGVWTSATLTRLERPDEFGNRRALTAEEAARVEHAEAEFVANAAKPTDLNKQFTRSCVNLPFGCGYNNFWIDRGSQVIRIDGEQRSSIIVEPANGKVPPLTSQRRQALAQRKGENFDGPEARPLGERCLLAFGSSSGPPMLPVLYNNHYQIVQAGDTLTILVEMVHDARIVRIDGRHLPPSIRKWMGDSIGRWEGDTLVVETTNFTDQESFRGATRDMKVTERFTRVAPDTIRYRFTIEDPAAFTQSWSGEVPFHRTDERIYEYACHEGNYALMGVLAGAREAEKNGTAATTQNDLRDE
jgi:hypothetical protein